MFQNRSSNLFYVCLMVVALALSSCGIKPASLAPPGEKVDGKKKEETTTAFPHIYPQNQSH